MNLGGIKTGLKRYGFDSSDPLTDWINAALHEFEDAYPWPWLEADTTVVLNALDNTIDLPADFYKLLSIKFDGYSQRPSYMSIDEFEEEITDRATESSLPTTFTVVGMDKIIVWPTPSVQLTVRLVYRKNVSDLVNDVDVPAIPFRHHYGLVAGSATYALQAENEEERAQTALRLWANVIDRSIARYTSRQSQQPDTVRDTAGYNAPESQYAPYHRP